MATATAAAPTLQDMRHQVASLETEISDLKSRLTSEKSDLTALEHEQGQLAEKIALGKEKASRASVLARQIEEAEARVNGFRSVIARKQVQLDESWPELRRLEAENLLAKRQAEVEALRRKGAEVVEGINAKLRVLIQSELPELDSIRDAMMQYRDLGGQAAGAALCETLLTNNGTLVEEDTLTNMRRDLHTSPPAWTMRGDLVLTVRNLWPAKL
jgi:chromosome segregation ATPase